MGNQHRLAGLRGLAALAALFVGVGALGVAQAALVPVPTDLWDVSQGSLVTADSGVMNYSPSYRSDIRDMFGAAVAPVGPGITLFRDYEPTGTLHWVEWQTPAPVTLRSFNLFALHDGAPRDATARGFSQFTLYAYNPVTLTFDEIYEIYPSNPYATTPPPPDTYIAPLGSNLLYLSANVADIVADTFRAEFVQYGYYAGNASGPRVIELDGFDTPSPFVEVTVIPEPATLSLVLLGLAAARRRRRVA